MKNLTIQEQDKFYHWWFKEDGFQKTEALYGKIASERADERDPDFKESGAYSDELEKLAIEKGVYTSL